MPNSEPAAVRQRTAEIVEILNKRYPNTKIPLTHDSPFQLVIATILSARCTDEMVNQVTPELFQRYPTPAALAQAPLDELERILYPTGFFRQKAKAVKGTATLVEEEYGGDVPRTMAELVQLPGVGRKTANVILGAARIHQWPGWAEEDDGLGIVVDTHVRRVSRRLGLTAEYDPVRIERDLVQLMDSLHWPTFSLHLIFLGREVCSARKADCPACPLAHLCPAAPYDGDTPWLE